MRWLALVLLVGCAETPLFIRDEKGLACKEACACAGHVVGKDWLWSTSDGNDLCSCTLVDAEGRRTQVQVPRRPELGSCE